MINTYSLRSRRGLWSSAGVLFCFGFLKRYIQFYNQSIGEIIIEKVSLCGPGPEHRMNSQNM